MNVQMLERPMDSAVDFTPCARAINADIVLRHLLRFRFRVSDHGASGSAHGEACDALHELLPARYPLWRYVDDYQEVCNRLELLLPEYDDLPGHPGVTLYNVTVMANYEIAATERDVTEARPLSVEHLVHVLPSLIKKIYAEHGLQLDLHSIAFRQDVQTSVEGLVPMPN